MEPTAVPTPVEQAARIEGPVPGHSHRAGFVPGAYPGSHDAPAASGTGAGRDRACRPVIVDEKEGH